MACRLKNTGRHPLRVDLRGGSVLYLQPGDTSRALRDELLYGNAYLDEWVRAGFVRRVEARMEEVGAADRGEAGPAAEPKRVERAAPADGERGRPAKPPGTRGGRAGARRQDED